MFQHVFYSQRVSQVIQTFTDHMLVVSFDPEHGWSAPKVQPFQSLQIDPSSSCLQYCPNLFEGMKAYYGRDGVPRLFRPERNVKRMESSAERVALPVSKISY